MLRKKVLLIGLDPAGFDYANSPFPSMTPEKVMAGLQGDVDRLNGEDYEAKMLLLDPSGDAASFISPLLRQIPFDCILIGAALRTTPQYFSLFEKILNLVHKTAPQATICFNTGPLDSLTAVRRWT